METITQLFVGGTGRSGTTILLEYLNQSFLVNASKWQNIDDFKKFNKMYNKILNDLKDNNIYIEKYY
jgi:hypothetical protein